MPRRMHGTIVSRPMLESDLAGTAWARGLNGVSPNARWRPVSCYVGACQRTYAWLNQNSVARAPTTAAESEASSGFPIIYIRA